MKSLRRQFEAPSTFNKETEWGESCVMGTFYAVLMFSRLAGLRPQSCRETQIKRWELADNKERVGVPRFRTTDSADDKCLGAAKKRRKRKIFWVREHHGRKEIV